MRELYIEEKRSLLLVYETYEAAKQVAEALKQAGVGVEYGYFRGTKGKVQLSFEQPVTRAQVELTLELGRKTNAEIYYPDSEELVKAVSSVFANLQLKIAALERQVSDLETKLGERDREIAELHETIACMKQQVGKISEIANKILDWTELNVDQEVDDES